MSSFPNSPHLVKGGLVLVNAGTAAIERIITLQYNPESISRSFQVKWTGSEGSGDRSEALRITGPPVETLKIEAEMDATDQLEFAKPGSPVTQAGIHPQLAALETIIYPRSAELQSNNSLAKSGTLEIIPMESALTLFIWNKNRILPVRINELSVTEEAFDVNLNPLRAKISLGMQVLTVDDLGFDHKGAGFYMNYHKNKEKLAGMMSGNSLANSGITQLL